MFFLCSSGNLLTGIRRLVKRTATLVTLGRLLLELCVGMSVSEPPVSWFQTRQPRTQVGWGARLELHQAGVAFSHFSRVDTWYVQGPGSDRMNTHVCAHTSSISGEGKCKVIEVNQQR